MSLSPLHTVQSAFGCQGEPVPLSGGQGETWLCGNVVLKPCDDAIEASWIADAHTEIQQVGFRVPQPVQSTSGGWVYDGWQAWTLVEGHHSRHRWKEVFAACGAFHDALRHLAKPAFLDERHTPFARADRIAWGEKPADCHPDIMPVLERLQSLVKPIELADQVIHGDFTENVLFDDRCPPAVIDFSPYWRPAEYAQAIIVVDALDWCGADESILQLVEDIPEIHQLMVRAEIFRIAIYDGFHKLGVDLLEAAKGHLKTVDMLTQRLG